MRFLPPRVRKLVVGLRLVWAIQKLSLLGELLRHQKRWVKWLIALGIVYTLIALVGAALLVEVVDKAIVERSEPLSKPITGLVVVAVLGAAVGFAQKQVTARIGYQVEYELRRILHGALLGARPDAFAGVATGQLVTRAITDLAALELVAVFLPNLAVALAAVMGIALVGLVTAPLLTLIALAGVPLNAMLVRRAWTRLRALSWLRLDTRAQVTTSIDENVRGIRVVKAFGTEAIATEQVALTTDQAYGTGMRRVAVLAGLYRLLQALPVLLQALIALLAVRLLAAGALTVGRLTLVLILTSVLTGITRTFADMADGWSNIDSGAIRIYELLNTAPVAPSGGPVELPEAALGLQVAGLGTASEPLSFSVAPGTVALVPEVSDAARTALIGALTGLSSPATGTVRVGGRDLTTIAPSELPRIVRLVGEEPFLFGRSVRANLTLGRAGVHDATLWAALRAARADQVVRDLPEGLDTVVGDRGFTLSGGERQRIALARALVEPTSVLLLDDALSAVNPAVEQDILQRIRAHAPETVVLVVSRRATAAVVVDQVVELPSGFGGAGLVTTALIEEATNPGLTPAVQAAIAEIGRPQERPAGVTQEQAVADVGPTIGHILAPFRGRVVELTLLLLVVTLAVLVTPALVWVVIDASKHEDLTRGYLAALGFGAVGAVLGIAGFYLKMVYGRINEGILFLLRRRTFARLLRLPVSFYDRELPGAVATRVVRDLDMVSAFIDNGLFLLIIGITLAIGTTVVVFVISPVVGWVVLGFVALLVVLTTFQLKIADRAFTRQRRAFEHVVSRIQEEFAGRHTIAGYGMKDELEGEFAQVAWELRSANRFAMTVVNGYESLTELVTKLASATLFLVAGTLALDGHLSIGAVIALQLYLGEALVPVAILAGVVRFWLAARVSFRKLAELHHVEPNPVDRQGALPCERLVGDLEFRDVTFTYPGTDRTVLQGVSLTVHEGEIAVVVGATGAGKSSLSKLLWRIYDPQDGSVSIGGTGLTDYRISDYRARLGVVPQEVFLFKGTVLSNICYAVPGASEEQARAALDAIGGADQFPEGLDVRVGEEGRNLTTTQRQYLALARVWLAAPDVLVLDEATSSMESEQEQRVMRAIRESGRTAIVVAHRTAVAQVADRVVVMDDGQIVEVGSHGDLAGWGGAYDRLWNHETAGESEAVTA